MSTLLFLFVAICIAAMALLVAIAVPLFVYYMYKLPRCPPKIVKSFLEKSHHGPIAHRGGRPENTLAAFRRAKQHGASGVEVDVRFTKDGHAVLMHDSTVDRTSDGWGVVEEMTLQELKELDVGSKFGSEFAGEPVPTLKETVSLCDELGLQLFVEFKGTSPEDGKKAAAVLKEILAEHSHLYDQIAVITFWPLLLYEVRKADPNIICGLSVEHGLLVDYPNVTQWWKHFFFHQPFDLLYLSVNTWLWELLGVSMLTTHKKDILNGKFDVAKWERHGVYAITWTVNEEEEKIYFRDVVKIPFMTDILNAN